ncbi:MULTISPECIES: patatin-like phospholipase family protein [unclassified Methylobacterium]|uniref:patatin-like phospholipase family protein n=1 Tax=unclassified Methylobacterium TaxID=2615210 RepID=UPI000701172C|nr:MULTISPECIES: patatin-like phospholipase family protein [unclassified Methylobacterium]KQO56087.1 patatin [Methylobacterium sp. Leaf86]KQO96013.1 patatin [Methylobacterium sp. Leaf91]
MSGSSSRHGLFYAASMVAMLGIAGPVEAAPAHAGAPARSAPLKESSKSSPARSSERVAFTAGDAADARPDGLKGLLRIPADDTKAFQHLIDGASAASDPWLVLSGGGENGAFAAGLLNGWSKAGNRPAFGIITGVSTGAMIAPFAFLGSSADATLAHAYTEISAADVFEFGGTNEALTDTWPLKRRIERMVTGKLLTDIAAEHAKGRRLLVATTAVDSERPVLWDMGAIASEGGPKALDLFRSIILASSAVPGVFPPVMIDVVGTDGKRFQEMHADGGTTAPFYLAPEAAILGKAKVRLPTSTVYLVVNNTVTPDFQMATRTTLSVLGRAMSAAIKAQTRAALALTESFAERNGLDLDVAQIDNRFTRTTSAPFDQDYMKALFAHGERLGRDGTAFSRGTPAASIPTGSTGDRFGAADAPTSLARR